MISLPLPRNASFTNPIEIKYSGNVFEAVKNTQSTCFKHYLKQLQNRSRVTCIVSSLGYETRSQKISLNLRYPKIRLCLLMRVLEKKRAQYLRELVSTLSSERKHYKSRLRWSNLNTETTCVPQTECYTGSISHSGEHKCRTRPFTRTWNQLNLQAFWKRPYWSLSNGHLIPKFCSYCPFFIFKYF